MQFVNTVFSGSTFGQVFRNLHGDMENKDGMMIMPVLLHPKSRGTLRLQSTDPLEMPLIDPDYLHEDWDVNVLVEGMYK